MAVGQNQWYHFGLGKFTAQFRTDFRGWIGMFTGGTIWILNGRAANSACRFFFGMASRGGIRTGGVEIIFFGPQMTMVNMVIPLVLCLD